MLCMRAELYPSDRRSRYLIPERSPRSFPCLREPAGGYDPAPKPRLFDRVRAELRVRHYSSRTEGTYLAWIRRYIIFHGKRHPSEMGADEVEAFLSALATERHVAASTQNQALAA